MASEPTIAAAEVVELSEVTVADLDDLLACEIDTWRDRFSWDFRPAADMLRRFVHVKALLGCALQVNKEIVGYAYYVHEGHKGLIGDFFVRPDADSSQRQQLLLAAIVERLIGTHGVRRIESQLMLFRNVKEPVTLPHAGCAVRHDRYFLEAPTRVFEALSAATPSYKVQFVPFAERYLEEMAHLLASSYRGHVDSEINDQYRSIPGARQFLSNIIRFPGCGTFAPDASVLAIDVTTGRLCAMCLASRVSTHAGHITQICVLPALRSLQIGYELIRQVSLRLAASGSARVSLTVTCANNDAVRLYRRLGFTGQTVFPALVWDHF